MRIGKYEITTDPLNYVLSEIKKRGPEAKPENRGREYSETLGYYNNLDALVRGITDDSIKRIFDDVQDIKKEAEKILTELVEETMGALDK